MLRCFALSSRRTLLMKSRVFLPSLTQNSRSYVTEINVDGWSEEHVLQIVKKYYPKRQPQCREWGGEGHILHGVNVLKDGQDPVIGKKEEYPEWVFNTTTDLTLEELIEKQTKLKAKGQSLSPKEVRRLKKLKRRELIKENNYDRVTGVQLQ